MTEQTLNIDYHIRNATLKALNKNKCFVSASKDLGVRSRRVVERLIRDYKITFDHSTKKYISQCSN